MSFISSLPGILIYVLEWISPEYDHSKLWPFYVPQKMLSLTLISKSWREIMYQEKLEPRFYPSPKYLWQSG